MRLSLFVALALSAGCSGAPAHRSPPLGADEPTLQSPAEPGSTVSPEPAPEEPVEAVPKPATSAAAPASNQRCTVTDSNGPRPGGASDTRGCADGETCECESRAGYSCSGTCRPTNDSESGALSGAEP